MKIQTRGGGEEEEEECNIDRRSTQYTAQSTNARIVNAFVEGGENLESV